MAAIYSTKFLVGNTDDANLVYQVQPGFVAVLRDVVVYNNSAIAAELFLEDFATGAAIWRWDNSIIDTNLPAGSQQWQGRQVFGPEEGFRFRASEGTWDFRACGYLLTAP